jgi:hypothetical protein
MLITQPSATIAFQPAITDTSSTFFSVAYICGGYQYALVITTPTPPITLNLINMPNALQNLINLKQTNSTLDNGIYSYKIKASYQNAAYTQTSNSVFSLVQYALMIG